MQKIREILLNEYIGAIAIGLLLVQAAGSAINVIVRIVRFYLEKNIRSDSVFSGAESAFPWISVAGLAINLVLYLLIIYLLLYWLYLRQAPPELPVDDMKEGSEQQA
jgi:hypothetical protein